MLNEIRHIIIKYLTSLGQPRRGYNQIKFDCPICDKGHKKNLEICVDEKSSRYLLFNCWSCHYSGYITQLLKDYASDSSWESVEEFKSSSKYTPKTNEESDEKPLLLPKHTIPFYLNEDVRYYLVEERGMDEKELLFRNVRYCFLPGEELYDNIIFPFYEEGKLVGLTTQNFTTKKYRNHGKLNFVAYKEFINIHFPIIITEGIYDALSVINAIPILGTMLNKKLLQFIQGRKIILALDNNKEVSLEKKKEYVEKLNEYGAKIVVLFELGEYKDLNELWTQDRSELRNRLRIYFELLQNV